MANNDTQKRILSAEERAAYKGLLTRAFTAAQNYHGAEAQYDELMSALIDFEDFVRERSGGEKNDALQREFSRQSGTQDGATIPELLDIANGARLFNHAANPNDLDAHIAVLKKGGALIITTNAVFVQTDDGTLNTGNGDTHTPYEVKFQPRLKILTEALQSAGIFFDDLIIHVGQVDKNMLREAPYIVIDIPRLGRQIALNNQVGNITFVSDEILDPRVYEQLTKSQLKTLPGMHTLTYSDHWAADAVALLREAEPKNGHKRNLKSEAQIKRGFPLTVGLIVESAQAHFDATGQWPKATSGEILYGPLKGDKWGNINTCINARGRGLDKAGLPDEVKGLASLLESQKLTVSLFSSSKKITVDMILQSVRVHFNATGQWLTQNSGEILHGPLKGYKWGAINQAIRKRGHGLYEAGLPDEVKGLASLLEWQGLTVSLKSPTKKLTVDLITQSARAHFDATGQWPTETSGEILHGPLKGDKWRNIQAAISRQIRGLDEAGLPEDVKGISSLIKDALRSGQLRAKPLIPTTSIAASQDLSP